MLLLTCKHKLVISIITGSLLSLVIEVIQLISHRGLFEFDDIFHNTLGTVVGIGVFVLITRLLTATGILEKA